MFVMAEEAPKVDARLEEGVAYFEQVLDLVPDDRTALEFLVVAYEQNGNREKYEKALVSLAKVLVEENDQAALKGLLPRLQACDNASAKILALRVNRMTAEMPELEIDRPSELSDREMTILVAKDGIAGEIALVDV